MVVVVDVDVDADATVAVDGDGDVVAKGSAQNFADGGVGVGAVAWLAFILADGLKGSGAEGCLCCFPTGGKDGFPPRVCFFLFFFFYGPPPPCSQKRQEKIAEVRGGGISL
jgi:hypothetical protein